MARLLIVVPERRDRCGKALVLRADGSTALGPFLALATASRRVAARHGNPTCDGSRPFGHPPAGSFVVAGSLPPRASHRRSKRFGALGAFLLRGDAGPARRALELGRGLVALHGGPTDRRGRLRPTRGGLRVRDADLAKLFVAVNELQAAGDPLQSVELVDAPDDGEPTPAAERPGGRRYVGWTPRRVAGGIPPAAAAGALAAWLAGRKSEALDRRAFLAAAVAAVGGLGLQACSTTTCAPGVSGNVESAPTANPDGGPPLVVISGALCDTATYELVGDQLVLVQTDYAAGGGGGGVG